MTYPMVSCVYCKQEFTSRGIQTHYNQNHNPEWKAAWAEKNRSFETNRKRTASRDEGAKLETKKKAYYLVPRKCECGNFIDYHIRTNKYCSASCATTHSNKNKPTRSVESRLRTAIAMRGRPNTNKGKKQPKRVCAVTFNTCSCCSTIFYIKERSTRTTCSTECQTHMSVGNRPYTNGRRKIFYTTQTDGRQVILESSWEKELADFMDHHLIRWSRPRYVKYQLLDGSDHQYYPDFLLDDYGLYLDPKNNTSMLLSVEKMNIVSAIIPLWYGEVDKIKTEILLGIKPISMKFSK